MNFTESALVFSAAGEPLLGIVAHPDVPADCGVLILVGGPQYRIGSHRQFLLLARSLAAEGYPSLRFDYRGMGDSGGAMRDFEAVSDDVGAAIDAFQQASPTIRRVVLWGLCDAASAALLYVQARRDARISGLALLNPWVRSEASLAQTHIKHYYGQRLMERAFWLKLLSGKLDLLKSLRGFLNSARQARPAVAGAAANPARDPALSSRSFQDRMAEGLRQFPGAVLLILSGDDYTAKEFLAYVGSNAAWSGLIAAQRISRVDVPGADHTFSTSVHRARVESETLEWLATL